MITSQSLNFGPGDQREFRVVEATPSRRALIYRVYAAPLVQHYFGKIPKVLTMAEVKSVAAWLRVEQARRTVEAAYIRRLAAWLKKAAQETSKTYRAGTSEAGTLQLMEMRFNNFLPEYLRQLYIDTLKATAPVTPFLVTLQRKVEWELIEPTDLPEYQAWMNRVAAAQVRNVTESTKQGLIKIIDDGIKNFESIDVIADRIQAAYAFSAYRAQVIARTEVVAASNSTFFYSVNRYYNVNGATKTWLATNDKRTRPTHVRAGVTQKDVPFGDEFIVGSGRGMFPGDSQLPPRERIQCRCTALYHTQLF